MTRTKINESAPVIGRSETEIDAPVETVWDVLTAVESWPAWNPEVKSVSYEGELGEGASFRWKAGRGRSPPQSGRSTLRAGLLGPGRRSGSTPHTTTAWRDRNGKTFARTEESYEGLVARVLRRSLQKTLDKALEQGLAHLKREAERRDRS
jgi:Polyketide cyclase / dehydrase and lipid transport